MLYLLMLLSAIFVDGTPAGDSYTVTDGGVLSVVNDGVTTIYSPSGWSTLQTTEPERKTGFISVITNGAYQIFSAQSVYQMGGWKPRPDYETADTLIGNILLEAPQDTYTVRFQPVDGYFTPEQLDYLVVVDSYDIFEAAVVEYLPIPPRAKQSWLGTNIPDFKDYVPICPTNDMIKVGRQWESSNLKNQPWNDGRILTVDSRGYVVSLLPDQTAKISFQLGRSDFPWLVGDFLFTYEGSGEFTVWGGGKVEKLSENRYCLSIPAPGQFSIIFNKIDPTNYPKNMHLWIPGKWEQEGWNPEFIAACSNYAFLRYAPSAGVNSCTAVTPADLINRNFISWTWDSKGGMPIYWQCQLANAAKTDLWVCIPEKANDELVVFIAQIIKENLVGKAYIEYTNEAWNPQYTCYAYCNTLGLAQGLSTNTFEAGRRYYAKRASEIGAIVKGVLGEQCVIVAGSQAANAWVSKTILSAGTFEALAIAPYFNANLSSISGTTEEKELFVASNWSEADVLNSCSTYIDNTVAKWLVDQKAVADAYAVKLIAYEGGQHLAAVSSKGRASTTLTTLYTAVNKSQGMGELYTKYLNLWLSTVGENAYCNFLMCGPWSNYGSWGLQESLNVGTPKQVAVEAFLD